MMCYISYKEKLTEAEIFEMCYDKYFSVLMLLQKRRCLLKLVNGLLLMNIRKTFSLTSYFIAFYYLQGEYLLEGEVWKKKQW